MIHVRRLRPGDAPAIAAVHRRALADAIAGGTSLSYGLFDRGRLVGYLLCHGFAPTIFPKETGEALYVEHLGLLPRYRRLLPRLIRRFGREARRRFPGSAIEAHAVESAFRVWHGHPAFFAGGGYAITRHADSGEMLKGEIRYLVRWQPIPDWGLPTPAADDLLARQRGLAVEANGLRYEALVVRDEHQWDALAPSWDRLLLALPGHTVFQSHEHQRLWWRHNGGDDELFVVLLRREGEVRGIAPLRIETVKQYGRWRRRLASIGSRADVDRPQFLFPAEEESLARALVAVLALHGDEWDCGDFPERPAGSASVAALEAGFRSAGFLVGKERSLRPRDDTGRLHVYRRTPFFLALHLLRFGLRPVGRLYPWAATACYDPDEVGCGRPALPPSHSLVETR